MVKHELNNVARLAATAGLGAALTFSVAPTVVLAQDGGQAAESVAAESAVERAVAETSESASADATTLPEAVNGVITLEQNMTISAFPDNWQNLTIDLNGCTLTYSSSNAVVLANRQNLTIKNGTVKANEFTATTKAFFNIESSSSIELDRVTLITNGGALYPRGDAASVTVNNSKIYAPCYAVATNANGPENYNVEITLTSSEFINAMSTDGGDGCPVMINVPGTLNMKDCTVIGTRQAVLVRGGTANIKNCVIKLAATNDNSVKLPEGMTGSPLFQTDSSNEYLGGNWGSGNEVPNYALVVGNRSKEYAYPTNVMLSGTSVTGSGAGSNAAYVYGVSDAGREVSLAYDAASTKFSSNPVTGGSSAAVGAPVAEVDGVTYASLQMAISAAENGQTIKLVGDVDNEDDCQVELTDKTITLDLAGHTLKITTAWTPLTINGENAKLTITDSSDEGTGTIISTNADPVIQVTQGELDFQSGTLEVWDKWKSTGPNGEEAYFGADGIRVYGSSESTAANYSVVRVGADATIRNLDEDAGGIPIGSGYAIDVNYDKSSGSMHAYGVSVEFSGTTENAGMYVNGSIKDTSGNVPELTLGEGAQVDGMIYAAGYAKWTIAGAEIAGDTGMEIRAGELTMTAGSITGKGQPVNVQPNGNGSTTSGAGLAIAQHTTKLPIKVNVSGGTISGYTAFYESTPQKDPNTGVIYLSITGGSFVAINGGKNAVYSASKDEFISGGSFSSSPVDYLDPDCAARVNSSTSYTVMERGELPAGTYEVPKDKPLTSDDFQSGLVVTIDPETGQATATRPQAPSQGEHAVKVEQAEGGKVSVTPARADEGDEVTITATPDKGQEVRSVAVTTKDGKKVKVTKGDKAGTWTFEMPDSEVTVKVTFGCDGGELCPTHKFDDVSTDAWYHDVVDWAVEEGLLSGYADGTLGPDGTLSRAQLATVLWRQAGEPAAEGGLSFADCDPEAFYAEAVAWADEAGIIEGYGDGTNFGPEDSVTREQLATILWRQAGEPEGSGDLSGYPDGGDATDYAVPALEWAVDAGVLSGFGDGSLAPGGVLSRAMLAAMLQRIA